MDQAGQQGRPALCEGRLSCGHVAVDQRRPFGGDPVGAPIVERSAVSGRLPRTFPMMAELRAVLPRSIAPWRGSFSKTARARTETGRVPSVSGECVLAHSGARRACRGFLVAQAIP